MSLQRDMKSWSLVFVCLVVLDIVHAANPFVDGVVNYYKFDGNYNDDSGQNNHASAFSTTFTTDRFSASNKAVYFSGDDYVQINGQTWPMHSGQSVDAAFSMWINNGAATHRAVLWTRGDTSDSNRFHFYTLQDTKFGGDYRDLNTAITTVSGSTGPTIGTNSWAHVVVTRTGHTYTTYVDGVQTYIYTDPSPYLPTYTGAWRISGRSSFMFVGAVDDMRVYTRALTVNEVQQLYFEGTFCADATANDPTTPLASPTFVSQSLSNNNFVLVIDADRRFDSVEISWGNKASNACNMNSAGNVPDEWTIAVSPADTNCGLRYTFTKNAQTVVNAASPGCEFVRTDDTANDRVIFRQDILVKTKQSRYIDHAQALRNQTYIETKTTHYVAEVIVPTNVAVTSGSVDVTGNITVLRALTSLSVSPGVPNYQVGFTLLVSSQAPYQLDYTSFTSSDHLGNTITATDPDCVDPSATEPCTQSFQFSQLAITTPCPTKSQLSNEAIAVTFAVGCKPSFTGNCITPSPASITVSFTLTSAAYCPQVNDISLSATLLTYRDVALTATSAWPVDSQTTQYVVGSTIYGQVSVSVGQNAATLDTTKLTSLTTYVGGVSNVVYSGGTGSATVEDGDTSNGGSANWPDDNSQTRFAIPVSHDTMALDPITDVAQEVTLQAVVTTTYTTSSIPTDNALLSGWDAHRSSKSGRVRLARTGSSPSGASARFAVLNVNNNPSAPSTASGSVAGLSTMSVVGIGAAFLVLVLFAAYKVGHRASFAEEMSDKESLEVSTILRSSSSMGLAVESTHSTSDSV